jgi:hypothetical protein
LNSFILAMEMQSVVYTFVYTKMYHLTVFVEAGKMELTNVPAQKKRVFLRSIL